MAESNADLLIELGCEDLPAGSVLPLAQHLGKALGDALSEAGLCEGTATVYATPRRIAAKWDNVAAKQADQQVEKKGPAKRSAFADGEPTKALQGFLKSANATLDDIGTIDTPKGEWIVLRQTKPGKALAELVADAMPNVIKTMPMPKRMRWSDSSHEFLRPVVWLLALHGEDVLPLELLGLKAGNTTRGHRFHAPESIAVSSPASYEDTLRSAYVQADFSARRDTINQQVLALAAGLGGTAVSDDALLDEVTALVEWPVAVAGRFDEAFLEIPKEALIQTMQENQRYFAMLDSDGELQPAFITIVNIESSNQHTVVDGNERVIRPRFADTMFFWEQDKHKALAEHIASLDSLLFQEKLGSVGDKVDRLQTLSGWLATKLGASVDECVLAASLCKCDLNTEIVKELAKMQGIAGRYYAARDGHSENVAVAMEEHYFPKQAGGKLPANTVAQIVSLADKTDTLVGIYGLGMKPTGAKDPFGLRRAALGIVRTLIEAGHDLSLEELLNESIQSYGDKLPADTNCEGMLEYILERLKGYAQDNGHSSDVIEAVLAKSVSNPLDINARLNAISEFRNTDAAASLAAASKRTGNIIRKAEGDIAADIDDALLVEPAELALYETLQQLQPEVESEMAKRGYAKAMTITARLREPVDAFFDSVMVMSDDVQTRNNRLALLNRLNAMCSGTAEISRLQPQESA